jgi:hypothetical protein
MTRQSRLAWAVQAIDSAGEAGFVTHKELCTAIAVAASKAPARPLLFSSRAEARKSKKVLTHIAEDGWTFRAVRVRETVELA